MTASNMTVIHLSYITVNRYITSHTAVTSQSAVTSHTSHTHTHTYIHHMNIYHSQHTIKYTHTHTHIHTSHEHISQSAHTTHTTQQPLRHAPAPPAERVLAGRGADIAGPVRQAVVLLLPLPLLLLHGTEEDGVAAAAGRGGHG
jgi:hypothetical protein